MRSISTRSLSMEPIAASVAPARVRHAARPHRNIKTPARATCNARPSERDRDGHDRREEVERVCGRPGDAGQQRRARQLERVPARHQAWSRVGEGPYRQVALVQVRGPSLDPSGLGTAGTIRVCQYASASTTMRVAGATLVSRRPSVDVPPCLNPSFTYSTSKLDARSAVRARVDSAGGTS